MAERKNRRRPRSYTAEAVEEAISLAEERADAVSLEMVKEILIGELDVKATVRMAEAKLGAKHAIIEGKDRQIARLEKKIIRLEGIVEGRARTLKALQPKQEEEPSADHGA